MNKSVINLLNLPFFFGRLFVKEMKLGKYIFTILMAFVLTTSAIPLWAGQHYCQGKLVSSTYFSEAPSCGMEHDEKEHTDVLKYQQYNCCQDVVQLTEGVDHNITTSTFSQVKNTQQAVKPVERFCLLLNVYTDDRIPTYLALPPPLQLSAARLQVWLL